MDPARFRSSGRSAGGRLFSVAMAKAMAKAMTMAFAIVAVLSIGCRSQSGDDQPAGTPVASFTSSATGGTPPLTVQFTDTSTGEITGYLWDLGNGTTSTEANPVVTYPDIGVYPVSLTVTGGRGSSTSGVQEIGVADPPTAGFSCTPDIAFAPLATTCTSSAVGATSVEWDFGDGTTATGDVASKTYENTGFFTVTQTVANGAGSDVATANLDVYPISISATPPSGSPPGEVVFTSDVGGLIGTSFWVIGTDIILSGPTVSAPLRTPGTYAVDFSFSSTSPLINGGVTSEYVVTYGPPTAAFSPDLSEGTGPREVLFSDESTGEITRWDWDFGDIETCTYPETAGTPACDSDLFDPSSVSHRYFELGRYEVALTVTGPAEDPNDPELSDTFILPDAVTIAMLDASFEEPPPDTVPWTRVPPSGGLAEPVVLSSAQTEGADAGMPTEGTNWASLDGTGTDGSEPVLTVENGISQLLLRPTTATVLEFDYVLITSEPPFSASPALDAFTATVSDGTTVVEIESARADVLSAYAGPSTRYPTLGGVTARATPVRTASLDLATAFPGASASTVYTLTLRITNERDSARSPRAYVDNVRFVEPGDPLTADFSFPATVVAGQPVQFTDETCVSAPAPCGPATSWRWDFGITENPAPAATGSGERNPSYVFPSAGSYSVSLLARGADQESTRNREVTVDSSPEAVISVVSQNDPDTSLPTTSAPAALVFSGVGSEPVGQIVSYTWDFAGWRPEFSSSAAESPQVTIGDPGTWPITLTIETEGGLTDTVVLDVVLD